MSHRQVIIIALFLNYGFLRAQSLAGEYKYSDETISFNQESMAFRIQSNGGVTSSLVGQGQYTIIEQYLVVKTRQYEGLRSHYEKNCDESFGIDVRHGEAGYNVIYKQSDGRYEKTPSGETKTIVVTVLGGDELIIPYSNCHFYVSIYSVHVIEDNITVFKIHSVEADSVTLELITTNYDSGVISYKKLRKKEKRLKRKYGDDNYVKKFVRV
jgi:hypothetical protein